MSLKQEILDNEMYLLKNFERDYGPHIKNFISKINALSYDGDIVIFLSSPYLETQKQEQYDAIHSKGMKTAIDIMNTYDKSNLKYIALDDIKKEDLLTAMDICALAKNFNIQKGMYYNSEKNNLIIKSQIKDGQYDNSWIVRDKQMKYYLEQEKYEDVYYNLKFSHLPNQICRDIIIGFNQETRLYLFYRYNNGDRYFYAGEYKPVKFVENNKAIILENIDE